MSLVTAGLLVAAVIALLKGAWSASGLLTVISIFIEHRSGSGNLLARWKTRATPDAPARLTLQGKLIVTVLMAAALVALGLLGYTIFGHGPR
jgi:hypothetical protein